METATKIVSDANNPTSSIIIPLQAMLVSKLSTPIAGEEEVDKDKPSLIKEICKIMHKDLSQR